MHQSSSTEHGMIRVKLHRIFFPVTVLGFGKRLGIWMQGCHRDCPGCMSIEAKEIETPDDCLNDILKMIPNDIFPNGLTISGGEPFDQPEALRGIIAWYRNRFNDDVLVYTGYTYDELQKMKDENVSWVLHNIAALVDGPYIKENDTGKGLAGSDNQHLMVFAFPERYANFMTEERRLQCIEEAEGVFIIGLSSEMEKKNE